MRLFFLDIDGTICTPGMTPTPTLAEAIRLLRAQGDKFFISTGRAIHTVNSMFTDLGFDGGIYSAGGLVTVNGQTLSQNFFPQEKVEEVLKVLREAGVIYTLECEYNNYRKPRLPKMAYLESIPREKLHSEALRFLENMGRRLNSLGIEDYRGERVYKISFMCFTPAQMQKVPAAQVEGTHLVFFNGMLPGLPVKSGEISDCRIDKGKALLEICDFFGASPEDCIAFGDSMNDASMLRAAGTGVAMGNAGDDVKAIADRVCGACNDDGLAKALMEYVNK